MRNKKTIKTEKGIKEEIQGFSPDIQADLKTNPFLVPENYFEDLAARIQERNINEAGRERTLNTENQFRVFHLYIRPVYAVAAVLIIAMIFVSALMILQKNHQENDKVSIADNSVKAKIQLFSRSGIPPDTPVIMEKNHARIDGSLPIEADLRNAEVADVDQSKYPAVSNAIDKAGVSDDEIIDYLEYENEDPTGL